MMAFVKAIYVHATFVDISNISAVTDPMDDLDANCHNDICHGNIFCKFVGKVSQKVPTLPELLGLLPVFYQEFLAQPGSSWVNQ